MVKAIIPCPEKLSPVDLVAFQEGESKLEGMAGSDVCHIFIPVVIVGASEATLGDPDTKRATRITFTVQSEIIINGRATIRIEPQSKVVCAALAIRSANKDKG
jgi:hypothetical protein